MRNNAALTAMDHGAAIHAAQLDRLTDKGLGAAAITDDGIDWDTGVKKPAWLRMQYVRTAISQLYYGELATITMCERLLRELDDENAIRFVKTQVADEQRHAGYYERYLARAGGIEEICDGVAMAYEGALGWRGSYHGAIVAFHIVLEGEGLRLQQLYGDWFPCPLFKQMNALIARDEGRHVAFGKIFLRRQLQSVGAGRIELRSINGSVSSGSTAPHRFRRTCRGSSFGRSGVDGPKPAGTGSGRR